MEDNEEQNPKEETESEENKKEQNIDSERYSKYKDMFDKHKNEEGFINNENINEILNEFGRKTTIENTNKLIKKINKDKDSTDLDFDNFVKLMESEDFDSLFNKEEKPIKKLSEIQIYLFMLLLLITGSINTIANKLQQNTTSLKIKYKGHQKFITFCMFNGEFLCLLLYWLKEGRKKNQNQELTEFENLNTKKKAKFWYFLFPALFDILGSSISSISLSFLPSSIYQMFRGAIIIFTCTASILFLKNKYYRQHFLGICIVVIGLIIVGVNAALSGSSDQFDSKIVLGIFLVVLSQVFSCFLFVSEEKILKNFDVPPLKAVGLEGMWGVACYIILLFIFYFIRCESWYDILKDNVCIQDGKDGDIRFENAIFALKQIWESSNIKIFLSMYVLSIAFFNFSGLTISKYSSATSRTIVDTLRTVIVWTFFLVMPFVPEDTKETFSWLQLLGFLVLILGSLIYNEILVLKFWGFADNTKAAIKKRAEEEKLLERKDEN